ncbi:MAG: RNA polymerase sigma factor [Chitinophagales bacterium]
MSKEQQLINKAKRGDKRASQQLYEQYERYWFRICLRYGKNRGEAQDILQEGLIAVFRGLKSFNAEKGQFKSWSSKVVVNAALQYLKKHQWQQSLGDLNEAHTSVDFSASILDRLAAKELIALIQQLPLGYRIVFNMYVLEGYSHKEIAQQLNISVGTSKSQLSKAKRTLRERIEVLF